MPITRRDFLQKSAASAVAVFAYSFSPTSKRFRIGEYVDLGTTVTFPLGVSSGDATSERVILWTCYQGVFPLKLVVWEAGSSAGQDPVIFTDVKPKDGGFVHVDVTRLKPYLGYRYAFVEVDRLGTTIARSRIGRFKTAPDSTMLVPLTLGACSCTHNAYDPIMLEHAGAREDLDVFLLLGDTSYNDGCSTLKEFRASWAQSLSKKGYLDLRASTSVIAALDDHEICDNFDPETTSLNTLESAYKAFFENTPLRPPSDEKRRFWRSFRWGRTAEIFVLDARTERKPSTRHNTNNQYLSRAQMDWLKQGLDRSDAQFKIIMNSVPIGTFPFIYESDRWEGYPQQRNEILSFIDETEIPGVLWLSGDFHFSSVARVSTHGPGVRQTEILAGPGAQIPNYLALGLNASSQFDWASVRNNYVTLQLDPHRYEVKLVYQGGAEDPLKTRLNDIQVIHEQTLRPGKYPV